jgi:hypothetical protein
MATTGSNFVEVTASTLSGTTVTTAPFLEAMGPKEAVTLSQPTQPLGGSGSIPAVSAVCVSKVSIDPSLTAIPAIGTPHVTPENYGVTLGAFALNGCQLMSLSGTTPETLDLTDLTANSPASYAGDTTFAKAYCIIFNNLGAGDVVVTTGATNPAGLPKFNGTSAGLTVPAGSVVVVHSKAAVTVDSTHKLIVCTPAATTTLAITVCGA